MADKDLKARKSVVIRLKFQGVARNDAPRGQADARALFWWRALYLGDSRFDEREHDSGEFDEYEDQIRRKFGAHLYERLREHCGERADLAGTFLAVRELRYGSLELGVLVEGVDKFAKCFDENFSAFRLVFEHYGAVALNQSISPVARVECSIDNADEVERAFRADADGVSAASSPGTAVDAKDADRERRARQFGWLWILSNTSLILPVLLALWVLHEVRADLAEERHVQQARGDEVFQREQALIKAYGDRERDFEPVVIEALRSSASAAARSACCCSTCPPPHAASGPAPVPHPCPQCR